MKKYFFLTLVMLMLFTLFTACTNQSAQDPEETVASLPDSSSSAMFTQAPGTSGPIIDFGDKQLEGKVRDAMNKPEGGITPEEAAAVTSLNLSNESFDDMNTENGGIRDISALRYFTGLTELGLAFNNVSDLTPLSNLTKLEIMDISGTQVEDLSPIKDSQSLKCLVFCWLHGDSGTPKGIGSLDALAGMKSLGQIDAKNAGITDISALAGLPKLWEVQLNDNQISDISPLGNVKTLKSVLLSGNPITDYSPLKEIYPRLEVKDFEIK